MLINCFFTQRLEYTSNEVNVPGLVHQFQMVFWGVYGGDAFH